MLISGILCASKHQIAFRILTLECKFVQQTMGAEAPLWGEIASTQGLEFEISNGPKVIVHLLKRGFHFGNRKL